MEKITVEVIAHSNVRPEAGDVVQAIEFPEYFYFVSGRGDCWGKYKEMCFTYNAQIVDGKYDVCESWYYDKNVKIIRRNNQTFQYPETPGYTAEIDGVKYKLVPENEQ